MLSYPFSWFPTVVVVGVLVLFSSYLALLAFAIIAVPTLALVVALIGLAAAKLYALARRLARAAVSRPNEVRAGRTQRRHRGRLPA